MQKTALAFVLFALVGFGVIYGFSADHRTAQSQNPPKQQPKPDKRRESSRSVFKGLHNPYSQKLDEVASISKGDVRIEREIGLPMLTPHSTFDLQTFLAKRACDADAIVIGSVTKGVSHLTEDGTFIYTTYDVSVEHILKDNAAQSLTGSQEISLYRTGGKIELRGKRVVAEDKAAKALESGERYLLFLTYLPERSAYASDNLSYKLKGEKIVKLTEQKLEPALESGNDAASFVESIKVAVAAPCQPVGGER